MRATLGSSSTSDHRMRRYLAARSRYTAGSGLLPSPLVRPFRMVRAIAPRHGTGPYRSGCNPRGIRRPWRSRRRSARRGEASRLRRGAGMVGACRGCALWLSAGPRRVDSRATLTDGDRPSRLAESDLDRLDNLLQIVRLPHNLNGVGHSDQLLQPLLVGGRQHDLAATHRF